MYSFLFSNVINTREKIYFKASMWLIHVIHSHRGTALNLSTSNTYKQIYEFYKIPSWRRPKITALIFANIFHKM